MQPGSISISDVDDQMVEFALGGGGRYVRHVHSSLVDVIDGKPCRACPPGTKQCVPWLPLELDFLLGSGSCHPWSSMNRTSTPPEDHTEFGTMFGDQSITAANRKYLPMACVTEQVHRFAALKTKEQKLKALKDCSFATEFVSDNMAIERPTELGGGRHFRGSLMKIMDSETMADMTRMMCFSDN